MNIELPNSDVMRTLQGSLTTARFEVLPLRGVHDQVSHLPTGTTVTVTSSPNLGVEATVDLAETLSTRGYHAVPHLAARLISDRAHLSALLDRVRAAGMSEVFVIAGDISTPAGDFPDALALLRSLSELDGPKPRVGITGYPETHAFIPDISAVQAMTEKTAYADYIVSQICYDADTIADWVRAVRDRGVTLPIHIGVPGVVDPAKLLRISLKIGLGDSMRFLRKQHGSLTKLMTRYTPDELIKELAPQLADPDLGIAGWHFFTFNEVAKTHQWRQDAAARLEEMPA